MKSIFVGAVTYESILKSIEKYGKCIIESCGEEPILLKGTIKGLNTSKEICGVNNLECIHCNPGACDSRRVSK